jgi:hypothetical protein
LQHKPKNRISRTLTDPGKDSGSSDNNIRNAISLGNLLEDGNEGLLGTKVVSLSLGDDIDGIDADAPPPPLPPRRGSGQAATQPPLPRRGKEKNVYFKRGLKLAFHYTCTNAQVVTKLQQICTSAVPTTCHQDVFALLVPSLLTSCYKVVELNRLDTSCSNNLLSCCNSICQQVVSDILAGF